jgi:hypothetical protein
MDQLKVVPQAEEHTLFPELTKAGVPDAQVTVEQHKAIHDLCHELDDLVADVRKVIHCHDNSPFTRPDVFTFCDRTLPNILPTASVRF